VVEFIGERPVIDNSPATIEFAGNGRVGGNASCNRFVGEYACQDRAFPSASWGPQR